MEWNDDVLQDMGRRMATALGIAVKYGAEGAHGELAEEAPVDHGRLAGSFHEEIQGPLRRRVFTDVAYADAVRTGTKAHVIRPRHAKALRFMVGGTVVFATKVNHPGTKANDYVGRAQRTVQERVPDYVNRALRDVGLL